MKSAEIQSFQRIFLYVLPAKTCKLVHLKISDSVAFFESREKTTDCIILHLFSIICAHHFQVQKSIFAYLLEQRTKSQRN